MVMKRCRRKTKDRAIATYFASQKQFRQFEHTTKICLTPEQLLTVPSGFLHQTPSMDTPSNKYVLRSLITTCVRQKVDGCAFQIYTVSHSTHWGLCIHDVSKMWHAIAKVQRHIRFRIPECWRQSGLFYEYNNEQ